MSQKVWKGSVVEAFGGPSIPLHGSGFVLRAVRADLPVDHFVAGSDSVVLPASVIAEFCMHPVPVVASAFPSQCHDSFSQNNN